MFERLKRNLLAIPKDTFDEQDYLNSRLDAAVLVAFTKGHSEPEIILTQRSRNMRAHAGEVAFPGGKIERCDQNYSDTALRESYEEVGLAPHSVELLGQIEAKVSRTGIKVQPIVGVIDEGLTFSTDSNELDYVFSVPVSVFFDKDSIVQHHFTYEGQAVAMDAFQYKDFTIWGLTASIIVDVLNLAHDQQIEIPKLVVKPSH